MGFSRLRNLNQRVHGEVLRNEARFRNDLHQSVEASHMKKPSWTTSSDNLCPAWQDAKSSAINFWSSVLFMSIECSPEIHWCCPIWCLKKMQVTELLNSLLARFMLQYGNWHDRPFSSCVRAHVGELDELWRRICEEVDGDTVGTLRRH